MMMNQQRLWLALASTLSLTLAACGDSGPVPGEITLTDAFVADFDLVDHNGEAASDERFEGKPMLIYFGFTHCPDVCPASLSVMTASLDALGSKADQIQPLFITVDPERDTPEALRQHLSFDDRILGLTGEAEALETARKNLRMFAAKVPLDDSALGYTMDHQSLFFLIDRQGNAVRAFDDGMDPRVLARAVERWL
ncbi:MAG: SCO family protein [Pseudomonadota bacterium]